MWHRDGATIRLFVRVYESVYRDRADEHDQREIGMDRARTDGRFKREREAYATGWLALALSKLKDDVWWVEVETVDATPDTRLRQVEVTVKGNIVNTRNIENVDWEENVEDVMTVIRKKCQRRYPSDYLLLVHARNYLKEINFDRVIEERRVSLRRFSMCR